MATKKLFERFEDIVGSTITEIHGAKGGSNIIQFSFADAVDHSLNHYQDCCERVTVEDIAGDIEDLIGSPILFAMESTSNTNPDGVTIEGYQDDSFTWTFYRIGTIKGTVIIRWYGESNGYYSESVDWTALHG
jgi:hypothetical protein